MDAKMDPSHLGLVINGKRNPNRDMLIRVALAIVTTVDEAQHLLRYAGFDPLYVRRKRDVIIWFGLSKGESLDIVNDKRYGFIYVDLDNDGNGTMNRYRKDSFYWYKKVIESNGEDLG
jgi:hypothetical protein